jgi:hypothetical protein
MIKNVHVFFSPIEHETRLFKETKSIINLGLVNEVFIIGYRLSHQEKTQIIDEKRRIIRIDFPLKYTKHKYQSLKKLNALYSHFYFSIQLLFCIIKLKPEFISCHNLFLLPVSSLAKIFTKSKLIYVPHELETEKTGLKPFEKRIYKLIEPLFIKFVDKTVVVCEPIKDWYTTRYNLKEIFVVRNIPENPFKYNKSNILRISLGIDEKDIVFIYQGVIDIARGVKELIEVFKEVQSDRHIVFMGYGNYVNELISVSKKYNNIHYHPAVSPEEIISYSSGSDFGIFYIPGKLSLSYRYSLPNKFFEYILAGLPVIVNENLEYLSTLVRENQLGYTVDNNQQTIINLIMTLQKNNVREFKNIPVWQNSIGWHLEERQYKQVYQ